MTRPSDSDLLFLSALEQARLIREGQLSSLELTNLYLIESLDIMILFALL